MHDLLFRCLFAAPSWLLILARPPQYNKATAKTIIILKPFRYSLSSTLLSPLLSSSVLYFLLFFFFFSVFFLPVFFPPYPVKSEVQTHLWEGKRTNEIHHVQYRVEQPQRLPARTGRTNIQKPKAAVRLLLPHTTILSGSVTCAICTSALPAHAVLDTRANHYRIVEHRKSFPLPSTD